jgi:hypothetical protein
VEATIEISDEQLMLAVAKGDLNAFDEIVARHQELAWGIAVLRQIRGFLWWSAEGMKHS